MSPRLSIPLPDLDEARRLKPVQQKAAVASRLAVRTAKDKAADQAWEACKRAVDARDGTICRACGRKVVKTLRLQPNRAEHHHLVRRAKAPELLTDPRNVILVGADCHEQLTRHQLLVIGKASDMFTLHGHSCLNADRPLLFGREIVPC